MRKFLAVVGGIFTFVFFSLIIILATAAKDGDYSENYD